MDRALKLGGGCLLVGVVLMLTCCAASVFLGPRLFSLALPDPETAAQREPLDVEGECSRDAVVAYLAEADARLETLFEAVEDRDAGEDGLESLRSIDLAALREARDALAAREVAPCLREMQGEEVALADATVEVLVMIQSEDQPSAIDAGWALLRFTRTVSRSVGRIQDARKRLMERYDIPTPTPRPIATHRAPG